MSIEANVLDHRPVEPTDRAPTSTPLDAPVPEQTEPERRGTSGGTATATGRTVRRWPRQLMRVAGLFIAIILLLLTLSLLCFDVLSSTRAYIAAESRWSKAQRSAVGSLDKYAVSPSAVDWEAYEQAIAVVHSDRFAREAMSRTPPDLSAARAALLQADHPADDIDGMQRLFAWTRDTEVMREAIALWAEADDRIAQIERIADTLRGLGRADSERAQAEALRERLHALDRELAPIESAFSESMSRQARRVRWLAVMGLGTGVLLLVSAASFYAWRVGQRAGKLETMLRIAERRQRLLVMQLANENRELSKRYRRDDLTGLMNRRAMEEFLESILAEDASHLVVIFLDLDHFKRVNDTAGHAAGDELLRQLARRLKAVTRPTDMVARFAGDEFVIITDNLDDEAHVTTLCDRVMGAIESPFQIGTGEFRVSASLGLARFPQDGRDTATLLKNADHAMYTVKQAGRSESPSLR